MRPLIPETWDPRPKVETGTQDTQVEAYGGTLNWDRKVGPKCGTLQSDHQKSLKKV